MKQELKPCYCGAEANLMYDDSTQVEMCYVECSKCLMATMQDTYENVIKDWNTRPDHSGESQMRYEIAKDMMPHIYRRNKELAEAWIDPRACRMFAGADAVAREAITYADALINQLKQQSDEK